MSKMKTNLLDGKLRVKHRTKISILATIMASLIVYSTIPAGALTDTFTIIDEKSKRNYTFSTQLSEAKDIVKSVVENLNLDGDANYYVIFNKDHTIRVISTYNITVISKNGDEFNYEATPEINAPEDSNVFYCKNSNIEETNIEETLPPTQSIVADAIDASGFGLDSGDIVFISRKNDDTDEGKEEATLNTTLDKSIKTLKIEHHNIITVSVDSEKKVTALKDGQTVADVLEKLGVTLGENDRINQSRDTKITSDTEICIDRVEISEEVTNEAVACNTIEEKTDSLPKGEKRIKQEGSNGERKVTRRVTKVNGRVESAQELNSEVIKNPTDKVVLVGTKVQVSESKGTQSVGNSSGRFIGVFESTAYCIKGTTASGQRARRGLVAVDPRVIPLGTRLYIEGYGEAIAADTGGAIKGNIIDVYFETAAECYAWGRRNIRVRVLG